MSNFEGIVSAKIRGFQSHEETTISFHPNLNCIIGATDSGKSSILRALRLVIENKPSGNSFIRNGFDTASVEVSFSDTSISRNKGATNNYVIDGEVLKAFGQTVPDTVANKLRIDPDLSIQKQSSPYFLLGNTESERAKLVDSFCDISLASLSVANARRNALRADKQADSLRVSLTPLKAKQGALNTFAENKELVARIERGATKLDTVSKTVTSLTELQARYQKSNAAYNLIAGIGDFDVSIITSLVVEYQQVIQTITKLQEFARKLAIAIPEFRMDDSITDNVTTYRDTVTTITKLSGYITTLGKVIPSFDVDTDEVTTMVTKFKLMRTTLDELVDKQCKAANCTLTITEKQNTLSDVEAKLAAIPNCPLCGSTLCNHS